MSTWEIFSDSPSLDVPCCDCRYERSAHFCKCALCGASRAVRATQHSVGFQVPWGRAPATVDGAPANIGLGGRTGGAEHSPAIDESSQDGRPPWPELAAADRATTGERQVHLRNRLTYNSSPNNDRRKPKCRTHAHAVYMRGTRTTTLSNLSQTLLRT